MFKHFGQFSWNDYYEPSDQIREFKNEEFNLNNKSLYLSSGDSYVYNCYFQSLKASQGGAIFFSLWGSNFLVEKCSIYDCTATQNTAGIRVNAGNCVIAFVCGYKGYTSGSDGFSAVWDDSSRKNNSVFYSSISHCEAIIQYIMVHNYGNVNIKSVHLSHNKATYYSAICCVPNKFNEEGNDGSNVIYCSFSNNTAKSQICIRINNEFQTSNMSQMKNCNIIANKAKNTITSKGEITICHCSILNNISPYFSIENSKFKKYSINVLYRQNRIRIRFCFTK